MAANVMLTTALLWAALIGSALMAGLFFAFSAFIMRAFDGLPPTRAAAAMRAINVTILRSTFLPVFFGTALCGVAACASLLVAERPIAAAGTGTVVYVVGVLGVTVARNVPLNNALARAREDDDAAWTRYLAPWLAWNHLRTLACIVALAAFVASLA